MKGKNKDKKEKEEILNEKASDNGHRDNGHNLDTALEKTEKRPERTKPQYRPVDAMTKWQAENYLFQITDENLLERTRLSLKEVNIIASEIMHEEAVNPLRDRIKMPLTKVKRDIKMRALLSLDGQSRDEAVGMAQAKAEEDAAKAAFD